MAKLTKKDLVKAYEELDKVVGIDPAIEHKKMEQEEFEKELFDTYKDLVQEGDEFSKASQAIFDALEEKYGTAEEEEEDAPEEEDEEEEEEDDDDAPEEEEEDEEDEEEEDEDEEEEEDEEDDEEDDEEALPDVITKLKTKDELLSVVKENKEAFKGFKPKDFTTLKALKTAMVDFLEAANAEKEEKAPKKEKAAKAVPTAPGVKKTSIAERVEFVTAIINKGKSTKKEILDEMCKKFPESSRVAHQTILSDGKNPKYSKFEHLIVEGPGNILYFENSKEGSKIVKEGKVVKHEPIGTKKAAPAPVKEEPKKGKAPVKEAPKKGKAAPAPGKKKSK